MASQRRRAVVTDLDLGLEAIVAEISKAENSYVKVGFQAGSETHFQSKGARQKKGGLSMPEIAAANEFGTDKIPSRSFMRSTIDENRDKLQKIIESEYDKIVQGKRTVKMSLNALGLYVTGLIQKKIRAIMTPPNAPRTIKAKGSSKPLIDFGQMIAAVQHKVVLRK